MGSLGDEYDTVIAIALLILGNGSVLDAARAQHAGIKRTDLQRHDLEMNGREAVQVRVDFDPGSSLRQHTHAGEEIIYVLEGSLSIRSRETTGDAQGWRRLLYPG